MYPSIAYLIQQELNRDEIIEQDLLPFFINDILDMRMMAFASFFGSMSHMMEENFFIPSASLGKCSQRTSSNPSRSAGMVMLKSGNILR